jgi:hypothetical protein
LVNLLLHYALILLVGASIFLQWRRPRATGLVGPWINALLIAVFFVEVTSRIVMLSGNYNAPVYNLSTMLELALVLRIIGVVRPRDSWWLTGSLLLAAGMMVVNYVQQGDLYFPLAHGIITQSVLAVIWCSLGLWTLAQRATRPIWKAPLFWFFMGTMIYYAGVIPYLGFMKPLFDHEPELSTLLYHIITVVAITRYLFTAWACHLAHTQGSWDDER